MSTTNVKDTHQPSPTEAALPWASWKDTEGKVWQIEYGQDRIVLHCGDNVLTLPKKTWSRDILISEYDSDVVVRIETFDVAIGFQLSTEMARPLVDYIAAGGGLPKVAAAPVVDDDASRPLSWPKVSPLAVWALIFSAVSFIPLVGLAFAVVAIVLLIRHHQKVRKSRAWSHSRGLCTAAAVFLVVGITVSILGTITPLVVASRPEARFDDDRVGAVIPPEADAAHQAVAMPATFPAVLRAGFADQDWGLIVAGLIVILFSLTLHEAGHAASAWWLGDDLAHRMGRVSLSPMAHIDPFGTVLFPAIMFWAGAPVFGWAKPVPVMVDHLPRARRAHILTSLAGPGPNLLIAAASLSLLIGIGCVLRLTVPDAVVTGFGIPLKTCEASGFLLAPVFGPLATVLAMSFLLNVSLAFFNLIPIPPLDGSWVLEHMFPETLGRFYEQIRPYGAILFLALVFSRALKPFYETLYTLVILPAQDLTLLATGAPWYGVW